MKLKRNIVIVLNSDTEFLAKYFEIIIVLFAKHNTCQIVQFYQPWMSLTLWSASINEPWVKTNISYVWPVKNPSKEPFQPQPITPVWARTIFSL